MLQTKIHFKLIYIIGLISFSQSVSSIVSSLQMNQAHPLMDYDLPSHATYVVGVIFKHD